MKNKTLYVLDKDEVYHFRIYDKTSKVVRSFFKKKGHNASVLVLEDGLMNVASILLFTDGDTGEMVQGTTSIEARKAIATGLQATRLFQEAKREESTLKNKLKDYLASIRLENK